MKNNVSFNSNLTKFGMGLFETIKVTDYPLDLDLHMNRLFNSIKELNLSIENDKEFYKETILKYIKEGDYVYYVHSYYANSSNKELVAYSEYGKKIPGLVRKDNVYGLQFHPEKSGQVGADILKAYKELIVK